jgi:superfamily II DNA/RNA helicase
MKVLVVSPTRELATQLVGQIRLLGASLEGVRVVPVIGGANSRDQVRTGENQ